MDRVLFCLSSLLRVLCTLMVESVGGVASLFLSGAAKLSELCLLGNIFF